MRSRFIILVAPLWLLAAQAARATDEIQVYNAAIAEVGQFTIQQHLNYIPLGLKDPPFPGASSQITASTARRNSPKA